MCDPAAEMASALSNRDCGPIRRRWRGEHRRTMSRARSATENPVGRPQRSGPRGGRRIVFAYVCVLGGLVPVALGAVAGLVLANRCDAPGFECLGVLFAGPMIGAGVGVLVLFVVAIRSGLGWVWVLLTLLLFAAAMGGCRGGPWARWPPWPSSCSA